MNELKEIRKVKFTDEFKEFRDSLDVRSQDKIDDTVSILKTVYVLSTKFVKRIVNTDLYEMRASVGYNEYRTILFTIDHENIIQSTKLLFLSGFLKKSSKDYNKQVKRAENILKNIDYDTIEW
ncbi:hypothetical protein FACS1894145_2190 [Bacteroidia bacterium]|nr:hypothetical protein FACS1894145_2190 [Bacteroidia bacterium]